MLLVEQNFRSAATVADRHYVMEHGRAIDMISNAELERSMDKFNDDLGVCLCVSATSTSPEVEIGTMQTEGWSEFDDRR